MSAKAALRFGAPPDETNVSAWQRARLGVVVPLLAVVAVAILCIVIAGITSARQADQAAVERERNQFSSALRFRSRWSMRQLQLATSVEEAGPEAIQRVRNRLSVWLRTLQDHDLVVIADENGRFSETHVDGNRPLSWTSSDGADLTSLVGYLRGELPTLPAQTVRLAGLSITTGDNADAAQSVFLQMVSGRPAIVSSVALRQTGAPFMPVVLAVMFIDDEMLAEIGLRLQLENMRQVRTLKDAGDDTLFRLENAHGQTLVMFAWSSERPGAAILNSVVPFISIVLAGFAFLIGLVLRYMRHSAAAISAGEIRLRHLALHDPLCGLPNRIFFGERLEAVIAEVRRGGPPAALFYIDLDHFKDVNDTLGHPVGDELIRKVTMRLSHTLRGDDMVARLGGDEFAIITTATSDHARLQEIAERLIAQLCAPYAVNGHTIVIGASFGIAVIDGSIDGDAADIMRYADMALYRAKNEGRNRACLYDHVMDADLSQRKLLEQDLREAIEADALDIVFQPIVNASGEQMLGVEALARWQHPVRGAISPVDFIPIAEHSGLIVDLGRSMLRRACQAGLAWPTLTVAVNVSPLQFRQIDFVEIVERILRETGFDPARLELELTESTFIGNTESAEVAMLRLRSLGVRLALDDFGTGYSSLQYLRRFPFDRLKIDRSFVSSIESAADSAAIVHAIVSLSRGLRMKVTAEGVETAEQQLFLRAAGVHCMQGFRFGRPQSAHSISARLASPGIVPDVEPVPALAG